MPDIIITKNQLKILAGFVDEDDRTITLDDPKENITWSDMENIATLANNVLIGDKFGAQFSRIKEAKYLETTTTELETD